MRAYVTHQLFECRDAEKTKKRGRRALLSRRFAFLDPAETRLAERRDLRGRRKAKPPGKMAGGWPPREEVRRLGYPVPGSRVSRSFRPRVGRSLGLATANSPRRASRTGGSRENAKHRRTRSIEMAPPNRQAGGQKINRVHDTRRVLTRLLRFLRADRRRALARRAEPAKTIPLPASARIRRFTLKSEITDERTRRSCTSCSFVTRGSRMSERN